MNKSDKYKLVKDEDIDMNGINIEVFVLEEEEEESGGSDE